MGQYVAKHILLSALENERKLTLLNTQTASVQLTTLIFVQGPDSH